MKRNDYTQFIFGPPCLSCNSPVRATEYYVVFHRTDEVQEKVICRVCLWKPENTIVYNHLLSKGRLEERDIKDV